MNKDMFRGLVVGAILVLLIGYGVLYIVNLNARVIGIENFLNKSIQAQQQQRPQAGQVLVPEEPK